MLPVDVASKFWSRVEKSDGCWEWTGSRLPSGYGLITLWNKNHYAHRLSVQLSGRDIPEGYVVMHLCDNPPCVNPNHLRPATQAENRRDCAAKGRNPMNGNQLKTHCKRGHAFAEHGRFTGRGNQRVCRACECRRVKLRKEGLLSDGSPADDRNVRPEDEEWV